MKKEKVIKRRIIFINRYFYPDHSATSQILSDLAFYLSSRGMDIEIISSRQKYDNPAAVLKKHEVINGVRVNRIWTTRFGRQNLPGRAIDYLSFYLSAMSYFLFNLKSNDVVVAKTDPPLISIISALMCGLKGASLINWIQDLFPEVAQSLGVKGLSLVYPLLISVRNYSLRSAYKNVVIGEIMSQRLQDYGIEKNKIEVIHNWSIEDNIVPLDPSNNPLREEWHLQDKFVVGYSGNIGRAHEYATLLGIAKSLVNETDVVFVIIGGGALYDKFKQQVVNLGLTNVVFQPYQPKEILPYSLTFPDLHVISLRPDLEGLIVPSKFYGIAASGRPVLYIGNLKGEIPSILKERICGQTVTIGDVESAVKFIEKLKMDSETTIKMGGASRQIFDEKFNKQISFDSWVSLLSPLISIDNKPN
ncbi:MAG: glycosyltransferase family 4 protein [Gammaproteobacteria bacterium]|nr:glycosyltransferase family 4 protein [Gammaproteobacteria bacterium]